MNQEVKRQPQNMSRPMDVPYICRHLWKNLFVIFMSACIVGLVAFMGVDHYMGSSYTATMDLAMIARDNVNTRLNQSNLDTAMTRNLNVLNSEMLIEQICKDTGVTKIKGSLNAQQIQNTNLISLNATADSAEAALRLLKSALSSYPTLAGYFESGYMFRNLTTLSADNIEEQGARSLYYALLAAIAVLAGGMGITALICMSTDKIYDRDQAAAVLDIPLISTIHLLKKQKGQKAILISQSSSNGVYAEEIDKLSTQVQLMMDKENQKILMVNSIHENEGKSTIAVNLALNLAKRGKRVLLIDVDMRRPALAKIFDYAVPVGQSLSEFLRGRSSLKDVMYKSYEFETFRCIFQKSSITDPDKLLDTDQFKKLLQQAAAHMDYVILDTPPLGIVRDSELIASSVDASLLVIRQDEVRAAEVNDIVDVLDDTGVSVLGGVLNMVAGDKDGISRGKRYGKYYYEYSDRK